MSSSGQAAVLARNSISGVLRGLITVPITLALVPYLFARLGTAEFGLWSAMAVLTGAIAPFEFGLGYATMAIAARQLGAGEDERALITLNSAHALFCALAAVVALVAWLVSDALAGWLFPAGALPRSVVGAGIALAGLHYALLLGMEGLLSFLYATQRLDLANLAYLAHSLAFPMIAVAVIARGGGVLEVFGAGVAATLLEIAIVLGACARAWPSFALGARWVRQDALLELVRTARTYLTARVLELMWVWVDRLVLAHYAGPAAVAYYELGARGAGLPRALLRNLIVPLMPAAGASGADGARVWPLVRHGMRALTLTGLPVILVMAAFAPELVELWLGHASPAAAIALALLSVSYLVQMAAGIAQYVLMGLAEMGPVARTAGVVVAVNLVVDVALARAGFGLLAVLAGSLASALVGLALLYRALGLVLGPPPDEEPRLVRVPLVVALFALTAVPLARALTLPPLATVALGTAVFMALFFAPLALAGYSSSRLRK
jgi:O-antigen/teichoic acid export membrane protein